jgi:hypothetical protein
VRHGCGISRVEKFSDFERTIDGRIIRSRRADLADWSPASVEFTPGCNGSVVNDSVVSSAPVAALGALAVILCSCISRVHPWLLVFFLCDLPALSEVEGVGPLCPPWLVFSGLGGLCVLRAKPLPGLVADCSPAKTAF